jgi:hypothetical protein
MNPSEITHQRVVVVRPEAGMMSRQQLPYNDANEQEHVVPYGGE